MAKMINERFVFVVLLKNTISSVDEATYNVGRNIYVFPATFDVRI